MREYSYKKIDAFTSATSGGNPAACLYLRDNENLTEQEKQEIASQHKGFVSEVVYCKNIEAGKYELSYYSSECEVDFCGHGTIACMYSLIKDMPTLYHQQEITINTARKGLLTVYNKIEEQNAVYITAPKPTYKECSLTRKEIALNLGIDMEVISETYSIDIVNAGLTTLIVPITTLQDEVKIFPKEKELKEFCLCNNIDIILIFSMEVGDRNNFAHTRVFAPKFGYLEDPATGSGNSAFGYYMQKHQLWDGKAIMVEQGGEDIEYNIVKLSTIQGNVLFGGSATDRIIGSYLIP